MNVLQLFDKDILKFILESKWMKFKKDFWKSGGFTGKKFIIYFLLFLWALYTLARERGLLPKKNVKGKHIFITGGGSGLGRAMALKFA